ncbi:hypothetical protein [Candidatus Palauibacter sp.]|uniref:hypothetical protein n=1 Tax=Candidatus Palauibacter sp. TaxID=3101350 RepID=UPI003C6EB0A4
MRRPAVPIMTMMAVVACARPVIIMSRPANVEAGGLDCVSGTLQRIGYMITAGDRALGFVRAERTRTRASFPSGPLGTDVLVVNYITADAGDDESDDTIQVKASRTTKEQYEGGATSDAISDAERLLDQCGQI